jgi:integrase
VAEIPGAAGNDRLAAARAADAAGRDRRRPASTELLVGGAVAARDRATHESNFRRDVWNPAREAAGIDVRPHDCRHSWITQLRAAGVDDADLAAMSGHSIGTMLGTYTHALERSHEAVRELLG